MQYWNCEEFTTAVFELRIFLLSGRRLSSSSHGHENGAQNSDTIQWGKFQFPTQGGKSEWIFPIP